MGAQPARPIRCLRNVGTDQAAAELMTGEMVPVSELKRPELMTAGKLAFPSANIRWGMTSNEAVIEAVKTGQLPVTYADGSRIDGQDSTIHKVTSQPQQDQGQQDMGTQQDSTHSQPEPSRWQEPKGGPTGQRLDFDAYPETGRAETEPQPMTSTQAGSQLEEAIRAIAGSSVNEARVREIVADAVAQLPEPEQGMDEEAISQLVKELVADAPVTRIEIKVREQVRPLADVHHERLPRLIRYLGAGVHVYLVGPAGTGKSTMAEQAAEALGLDFRAMSLNPTMNAVRFEGYQDANGRYVPTLFREGYENGGLFLLDEIDNGHPSVISAINQAISTGTCAFADKMVPMHPDFKLVATANTYGQGGDREYVGRNQLDAATPDRFTFLDVPVDERMERLAAMAWSSEESAEECERWVTFVQKVRAQTVMAKVKFIASPRASIDGCKLLTAGCPWDEVEQDRLWKGISPEQKSKITSQYVNGQGS